MWMQKHFRDEPCLLVTVAAYQKVYDISSQLRQSHKQLSEQETKLTSLKVPGNYGEEQ